MEPERPIDVWREVLKLLGFMVALIATILAAVYLLGGCYRPDIKIVFYETHRCGQAARNDEGGGPEEADADIWSLIGDNERGNVSEAERQ